MTGRAALITGASGGLGSAIADSLGRAGYALTVTGRQADKLETFSEVLRAKGYDVISVVADVSEEADITDLFRSHRDQRERLDVLVNNAGVGIGEPVDRIQAKHLDLQLAVNLRGVILATREGLPMLREAGNQHGKALLLNVSSLAGKSGHPWISVYAATKAAVINFTESVQREETDSGVQCTALAPGYVDTPMTDFVKDDIDGPAMLQVSDIADVITLLLRTGPTCRISELALGRSGVAFNEL